MSDKLLSMKNDYVFKRIFSDPANSDALTDFLRSVLTLPDDEYARIEVADPHLQRHTENDKLGILDLRLHTASGKIIHLEIQIERKVAFRERAVYYGARLLADQVNRGDEYAEMRRVISIIITDFTFIEENDSYRNRYYLHDPDTGSTFSGILEINVLELSKLPRDSDDSELWNWLKLMNAKEEGEMAELARKNPNIGKVTMVIRDTDAIAGRASPLNPRVAMDMRSLSGSSLLVACRARLISSSSPLIPDPLSETLTRAFPPSRASTSILSAPASRLFSTSSFKIDPGLSTTSPAAMRFISPSGKRRIRPAIGGSSRNGAPA
jgi:predicted transposase/invertase (TIGR01784 family)